MADGNTIEIYLFSPGFEEFFSRHSQQIGKGELFIPTEESLDVGTPVTLVFNIVYEDMELLRATGSVFYVADKQGKIVSGGENAEPAPGPGIGVKIDQIDETFRAYIIELVKRQYRSDLSKMFTT